MKYFVIKDNKREGPFNEEELYGLEIFADTKVWRVGLEEWTEAQNIDELDKSKIPPSLLKINNSEPPAVPNNEPSLDRQNNNSKTTSNSDLKIRDVKTRSIKSGLNLYYNGGDAINLDVMEKFLKEEFSQYSIKRTIVLGMDCIIVQKNSFKTSITMMDKKVFGISLGKVQFGNYITIWGRVIQIVIGIPVVILSYGIGLIFIILWNRKLIKERKNIVERVIEKFS